MRSGHDAVIRPTWPPNNADANRAARRPRNSLPGTRHRTPPDPRDRVRYDSIRRAGRAWGPSASTAPPPVRRNVRWTGRFEIDPDGDVEARLATIAREIIDALRRAGPEVMEISLDVTAERQDGFDAAVVRTVTENSRTLGAARARFEDA